MVGLGSSGLAGASGFNNASIQAAEARQRKRAVPVVQKNYEDIEKFEMPKMPGGIMKPLNSAKRGMKMGQTGFARGFGGQTPQVSSMKRPTFGAGFHMGQGARKTGQFAQAHPFKALGIAGAGGAAATGAGAGIMQHRNKQNFGKNHYGSPDMDSVMGEEGFSKAYDPEEKRDKRNQRYQTGAAVAAGGAGAAAAHQGVRAGRAARNVKSRHFADPRSFKTQSYGPSKQKLTRDFRDEPDAPVRSITQARKYVKEMPHERAVPLDSIKSVRAVPTHELKAVTKPGKRAAGLALLAGGAGYAHHKIKQKRNNSWGSYSKRAPSAFGVVHD